MYSLGNYIKNLRIKNGYSQKRVYKETGITDSQQSRIERSINQEISPSILKKLAVLYDVNVIDLYILAGYLAEDDLTRYTRVFKYAELLTEQQHSNIQEEITLFTQKDGGHENAI